MTKIISIFIIVLVVVAGWKLFDYYKKVDEENQNQAKVATGADIKPNELSGVPWDLQNSLDLAQRNGANGLRNWLKAYGSRIQDPRKAWIEMDYCLAAMRDEPNEARRVFKTVKERTSTNSVIYPRIRQLEKTFE
jgi:hypothetical protein